MKALNQQQIKQEELKLLETSGFSLGECTRSDRSSKVLRELTHFLKVTEIERLKVSRVRNMGLSCNANLRSFSLILLSSIYSLHMKEDLLDIIKSFLYHPELDLTVIKHTPLPQISSKQMKKIVVEFFYSLVYSSYDDKIEGKLCKYPIVMDILVIFLRCLLAHLKVKHADDYLFKLPTNQTLETLVDFFDLSCKVSNSIFLLHEDKLFLYENRNGETLVGSYSENDVQSTEKERKAQLEELEEQLEEDTENEESRRQSFASHNRSLEFRGVVSESLVFEPEASTPFFNFEQGHNSSFQSSQNDGQESQRQNKNTLKQSKEMNLLKAKDLLMHQSQTKVAFGNMKRTLLENQLKESLEPKEALAADSPITLDSPHNFGSEGHFSKMANHKESQQVKTMKKSKSESARPRSSKTAPNNEEQLNEVSMKKKEKIEYGKPSKKESKACKCINAKRESIQLHSNLYEINMQYVSTTNPRKQIYQQNTQGGQYYINSKGLSCQLYAPASPHHNTSLQCIPEQIARPKRQNPNTSINSCYALPHPYKDSETLSRRQFSPISNTGQRSFSPFGGTHSSKSPKITFTYRNPLKYSIQFPSSKINNKK